jgi:hypothetical protein
MVVPSCPFACSLGESGILSLVEATRSRARSVSRHEPSHGGVHYGMTEQGPYRGGFMNNREDERVAYCSLEEWEA